MSRVLIVEDELHLAKGLRYNLEAEGHVVEVAGDGETAGVETDQHHAVGAAVALHDLVGDAGVGPAEVVGREHPGPNNERATVSGGRGSRFWLGRARRAHLTSSVEASRDLRDG